MKSRVAGLFAISVALALVSSPLAVASAGPVHSPFVDGNHRFDGVFVDLIYLKRLVRPGGVVFMDDYQLPGVARAVAFFVTNLGWTLEEVSASDGLHQWGRLRTSVLPDTRSFDHYIDF